MRILAWLTGTVLAAFIVVFALSNRQPLSLGLWPFTDFIEVQAYLAVLLALLIGLAVGWLAGMLAQLKLRARLRAKSHRIAELEREREGSQQGDAATQPHKITEIPPLS